MNPLIINFLLIIFVAIFCSLNSKGNNSRSTKLFVKFSFICLLIFRSLLDVNSVPDLPFYKMGYEQICNMDLLKVPLGTIYDVKMPEPGFRLLMKLISYLNEDFNFFLIVFGVFWILGYYKIIFKYSDSIILSIVILLLVNYNQSIFVLRQHFAIMLMILSYPYIISKDFNRFFLIFLLAISFHQTAIIAFPLYFLYHIKSNKRLMICLVVIAFISLLSFSYLFNYFGNEVLIGLSSYIESENKTNNIGALIVLVNLMVFIFFLKKDIFNFGINRLLFISLLLGVIILVSSIGLGMGNRLALYYTNISFLLIPQTMKYITNRFVRYVYVFMFLVISYYMSFYGSGFESLIYYKI